MDFSVKLDDNEFTKTMKVVVIRRLIAKLELDLEQIDNNADGDELISKIQELQEKLALLLADPIVQQMVATIDENSRDTGGLYICLFPPGTTEGFDLEKERLCKLLDDLPILPELTGSEEFDEKEEKVLNKIIRRGLMDQLTLVDIAAKEEAARNAEKEEEDKVNKPCSLMGLVRKLYRLGARVLRRTKN